MVQGLAKRVEKAFGLREVVDDKQTKEIPVERGSTIEQLNNLYG